MSTIDLTARDIAAAIAARRVSAAEIMQSYLDRVDAVNGPVNAICSLNPHAMDDARAADARLASGEAARRLEGVPLLASCTIMFQTLMPSWWFG